MESKKTESIKRKLNKGWNIIQRYSYGIRYWRFVKNGSESNYPRINEDDYCDLRTSKIIKEVPTNLDTPILFIKAF